MMRSRCSAQQGPKLTSVTISPTNPPRMPTYTEKGDVQSQPKVNPKLKLSDFTSEIEGKDLGELRQIWQDIAASECRMNLMSALKGKSLGFREIENFSLGLKYSFKSDKLRDQHDKPVEGVVKAAMQVKMIDEKQHHRELIKLRKIKRKKHLEKVYRDRGEEELQIPPSMTHINHLSIFSQEKFCGIPKDELDVPRIGEVQLSEDEVSILKKSPKFAIPQKLLEDSLKEEMEKAYSLVRIELREEEAPEYQVIKKVNNNKSLGKERAEKELPKEGKATSKSSKEGAKNKEDTGSSEEAEKEKLEKEEEARTRQVFDPLLREYD